MSSPRNDGFSVITNYNQNITPERQDMIKKNIAKNKELLNALSLSLTMEKRGYKFYMKAKEKSTNELGKKIFNALGEDENRHIDAIKKYCQNIAKSAKAPKLCNVMPPHKNIRARLIFGKNQASLFKEAAKDIDQLKAYEIAMQMETDGYNFYKKAQETSAENPDVKELYKFLVGEEKDHHQLIFNTYRYLKNPEYIFFDKEKPIVEGG